MQLLGINAPQQLLRLFQNMTIMSFVCRIQQGILLIQHHALDGGAADVKTYSHVVFPPKASSAGARPAHRRFSFDCRKLFGNNSSSQFAYKVIINQIVGTFNLEPLFYTKKIVFSAPKVKHFVNLPDFLVLIFFRGKGSLLRAKMSTVPGGTVPRLRCYACCRARLRSISKSTLSQEVFTKFPHSIKKAQNLLVFQKRSAPFFVVRTGPAYCQGRSLPAPAADVPVWSDSTAEIPAPAHCQGPGPRS